MKKVRFLILLFVTTIAMAVNANEMSVQSGNSTLRLCIIAPIGTTLDFTQPDDVEITMSSSSVTQDVSFVNIGGAILNFTVTIPSNSSATKVEIVQTAYQFRESYDIVNGQVSIQTFVPLSSSSSIQMVYIIVS